MVMDINWLLSQDDWIAHRTKLDLLGEKMSEQSKEKLRAQILSGEPFKKILSNLYTWPGNVLKRHNDSSLLIHKLSFLADVGIKHTDEPLPSIKKKCRQFPRTGYTRC